MPIMKILATIFVLIAFIYSLKNYRMTNETSDVWTFISIAMGSAFVLIFVRTIKEFWYHLEFEMIKVELIPVVIAFLLAASISAKRSMKLRSSR